MPGKKRIQHNEKIGLKLAQADRKLILESLASLPNEIGGEVRNTSSNEPVMLTHDD